MPLYNPLVVGSTQITDGSVALADLAAGVQTSLGKADAAAVDTAAVHNTGTENVGGAKTFTSVVTTSADLKLGTAGNGLYVKEGSNATMGTLTLNGTTEVTVSTTKVTATSRIFLTVQAPGGTPGGAYYVSSRSAGTSFGVKGLASDTSTVAWLIVEPA